MKKINFITAACLLFCILSSCSKPIDNATNAITTKSGTLDSSFGLNGVATIYVTNSSSSIGNAVPVDASIQNDGKAIILGRNILNGVFNDVFTLYKVNENGTLDNSFSSDGIVTSQINIPYTNGAPTTTGVQATALGVFPDGKMLISSTGSSVSDNATPYNLYAIYGIKKINTDGSIDISFGVNGLLIDTFEIAPHYTSGAQTLTGVASGSSVAINVQSDGSFIVAALSRYGNSFYGSTPTTQKLILTKYKPDGSHDNSFGINGKASAILGIESNSIKQQTSLINIGKFSAKLISDKSGKFLVETTDPNGNYVSSTKILTRFNNNGSIDNSFGTNGQVKISSNLISQFASSAASVINLLSNPSAIQSNGNIIVGGGLIYTSGEMFYAGSYLNNGSIDGSFANNGFFSTTYGTTSIDEIYSIGIQSSGKIVLSGKTYDQTTGRNDIAICRLNTNGSIDTTFGNLGKVTIITASPLGYMNSSSLIIDSKDRINIFGGANGFPGGVLQIRYNK